MTTYKDIKDILETAISHKNIGGHGPFWRDLNRDEFVQFKVAGKVPLFATKPDGSFDGEASNIIHALRGTGLFGKDIGNASAIYDRMPDVMPAVPESQIKIISKWIESGCPA